MTRSMYAALRLYKTPQRNEWLTAENPETILGRFILSLVCDGAQVLLALQSSIFRLQFVKLSELCSRAPLMLWISVE